MKIKTIIFFGSLFFLFACNKEKIKFVQNRIIDDSLTAEGYMKDSLNIGYWKYYDSDKNLVAISEYLIIDNRGYLNQEVVFDKKGDTLFDKSNFFTCKTDKLNNDSLYLEIKYEGIIDAIYNDSESYPILVYHNDINDDFTNINMLKLDTLFFKKNKLNMSIPNNKKIRGVIKEIIFLEEGGMQIRDVYFDYGSDYQDISEIK